MNRNTHHTSYSIWHYVHLLIMLVSHRKSSKFRIHIKCQDYTTLLHRLQAQHMKQHISGNLGHTHLFAQRKLHFQFGTNKIQPQMERPFSFIGYESTQRNVTKSWKFPHASEEWSFIATNVDYEITWHKQFYTVLYRCWQYKWQVANVIGIVDRELMGKYSKFIEPI